MMICWDSPCIASLEFTEKVWAEEISSSSFLGEDVLMMSEATETWITTYYDQGLQKMSLNLEANTEGHTRCFSCQLRTGNWSYSSHGLTEKHQLVWWLSVSAAAEGGSQVVGSESGVTAWKQGSILLCMRGSGWWWCDGVGGFFLGTTLGLLAPSEHQLNSTVYLSVVADPVHPFMITGAPAVE